jgi:hypothetical protein
MEVFNFRLPSNDGILPNTSQYIMWTLRLTAVVASQQEVKHILMDAQQQSLQQYYPLLERLLLRGYCCMATDGAFHWRRPGVM